MNELTLTPRRPYMLRAFYDWLVDNALTPHLVVDATLPNVNVPMQYVEDGQIVLNLAPKAIGEFAISNEELSFIASFGGVRESIFVPIYAVMAIYARENGAGTMFEPEPYYVDLLQKLENFKVVEQSDDIETESSENEGEVEAPKRKGPPTLTVVK